MSHALDSLDPRAREYLQGLVSALLRDIAVEVLSAAAAPSAAAANAGDVDFNVTVRVKDSNGLTAKFIDGAVIAFTVVTDNAGETVSIVGTPSFVEGRCTITLRLTDGTTWAEDDTVTLKVSASEIGGYSVVNATGFVVATLAA